jgi:hypothetical protein
MKKEQQPLTPHLKVDEPLTPHPPFGHLLPREKVEKTERQSEAETQREQAWKLPSLSLGRGWREAPGEGCPDLR